MMNPMALLTLARDNKHKEIQAAAYLGAPIDVGNQMGQTPLHIASLWGNIETVKTLLDLGCDPSIQNTRGMTPLHFAASAKRQAVEVCELLIKRGAQKDVCDKASRLPYECASSDDVRTLLGGPDKRLFQHCDEGRSAELQELLSGGTVPSVRVIDQDGRTPLNLAVAAQSLPAMQVLLAHDPGCLTTADIAGDTALHVAVETGCTDALRFLLSQREPAADVNARNNNSSEYASGNWILLGEPLAPLDKTPLHVAVAGGDVESAELLLQAGADPSVLDFDGSSALHLALEGQDIPLVQLLLRYGADVNQPNKDFTSALHFVASRGPCQLLQLLLENGANAKVTNAEGWTPLMLAARAGSTEKAAALVTAGVNVNATTQQGNTALHLAAVNGKEATAQLLLDRGASTSAQNADGKTPADLAKAPGLVALLAAGA